MVQIHCGRGEHKRFEENITDSCRIQKNRTRQGTGKAGTVVYNERHNWHAEKSIIQASSTRQTTKAGL